MRQVLTERGVDSRRLKSDDLLRDLGEMTDFKYEKTKVDHMVSNIHSKVLL